jgi:hypothetical protein
MQGYETIMASYTQGNTEPPKERIDSTDGQLMVITAFGLDFFQGIIGAIPFAGPIIAPVISLFIWFTFFIWLKLHGVSITDTIERIALMFGGFLLELVPLLNILPIWTLTILITVLLVQRSDRKKREEFYRDTHTTPQQI